VGFPKRVRRKMFKRDNAVCQSCGRRWDDGWMLHAAHYENGKSRPTSNNINVGRMCCVKCHLLEHTRFYNAAVRRSDEREKRRHKSAVGVLRKTNHRRRGW